MLSDYVVELPTQPDQFIGPSDERRAGRWRGCGRWVPWGLITLSVVALAALGASGWLGGKLTYRYGVRVVDEATQADGFTRN